MQPKDLSSLDKHRERHKMWNSFQNHFKVTNQASEVRVWVGKTAAFLNSYQIRWKTRCNANQDKDHRFRRKHARIDPFFYRIWFDEVVLLKPISGEESEAPLHLQCGVEQLEEQWEIELKISNCTSSMTFFFFKGTLKCVANIVQFYRFTVWNAHYMLRVPQTNLCAFVNQESAFKHAISFASCFPTICWCWLWRPTANFVDC